MSVIASDITAIGAAVVLAAITTASPEFTVSATAAIAGQPEIGLGDALGSNVVAPGTSLPERVTVILARRAVTTMWASACSQPC